MVQSLLTLRFANTAFEGAWNRNSIRSVKITFKETIGVQGRAGYFDKFGITRDVMQNHLLQVLALCSMEMPASGSADDIRDEKLNVLRSLYVWGHPKEEKPEDQPREINVTDQGKRLRSYDWIVRGQYEGYRDETDVPKDSQTETFSTAVFGINNERWKGVPFILKCAKGVESSRVEVRIQFRKPRNTLFPDADLPQNELVIRVQPDEAVYLKMITKKPGLQGSLLSMGLAQAELDFTLKERFKDETPESPHEYVRLQHIHPVPGSPRWHQQKELEKGRNAAQKPAEDKLDLPDAYEKLLWDVTRDDQSLFVRYDELEQAWIVFEPILKAFEDPKLPLYQYKFGTRGPEEADEIARKAGFVFNTTYHWSAKKEKQIPAPVALLKSNH